MTIRADIATTLRAVVDATTGIGASWTYYRRTSGPSTRPEVFAAAVTISAHQHARTRNQEFDDTRGAHKIMDRCGLRVSDAVTLYPGDQVEDPSGERWAVVGIRSSGVGTIAYDLARTVPTKAEPLDRGGGV